MAYAALISLAQTIDQMLKHGQLSISVEEKQHIISLHKLVLSLQASFEEFPQHVNSLEGRTRDVTNEAEDIIEYLMLEQICPCSDNVESENEQSGKFEHQLKKVVEEIDLISNEVMEIKDNDVQPGVDSSAFSSSSTPPPLRKDAMVGFQDDVVKIKGRLCGEPCERQVIPICGMGGIGKTTFAKNVYNDPLIICHFEIRVWITISQDFSEQGILSSLLDSLKEFNTGRLGDRDAEKVFKILKSRRYLVVMDDMWSREAWDVVRNIFPDDSNGSRIMLTTRLSDVASYPDPSSDLYVMSLMDDDQSWDLLKQKVFKDDDCSSELEKIGKEIAGSCRGLPLAIVVIAGLLSMVDKEKVVWREIAENVNSANTAEHGHIEEILSLSYNHLPHHLRPCFLYMGSFPEDHEIHSSKLTKLWVAEGFLRRPNIFESLEEEAEECLEDLVRRSLVLVTKRKSDGRIKSCSLHDLMRDMCIRKADESKFFLNLMDRYVEEEHCIESIKDQRRISVHSSSLKHIASIHASSIHTIMCSKVEGSVVLNFLKSVRLLRVLDAEIADVDSLSTQLFELFHLKYLAIRYSHGIPIALLRLQNLQTLVIHAEKREKFFVGVVSECSMQQIWMMPQLRHIYFHGVIGLYDQEGLTSTLENMQTLSRLSHHSCTERIMKMFPNLKKLRIECSIRHQGKACLNDLVHLHQLENLEIYAGRCLEARPKYYDFTFPKMLKKLTLRSLRLPWNQMTIFGSLPNLRVLKLRDGACVGSKWETTEEEFPELEFLLIEASMLEDWITESSHFPSLKCLLLHSCGQLNEIPNAIGEIPTLELIEVKGNAKQSLVESAEQIRKEQEDWGNDSLQVLCITISSRFQSFGFDQFQLPEFADEDEDEDDDDDDDDNEDDDE